MAYAQGYQFQAIITNGADINGVGVAFQAALKIGLATPNANLLQQTILYCGAVNGFIAIGIIQNTTIAPAINTTTTSNYTIAIKNTKSILGTLKSDIEAGLNTIVTANNQIPSLDFFNLAYDGINIDGFALVSYLAP
jgi:hypothetical protein